MTPTDKRFNTFEIAWEIVSLIVSCSDGINCPKYLCVPDGVEQKRAPFTPFVSANTMPEQQAQQGQGTQAGEGGGTWNTAIKIIQV